MYCVAITFRMTVWVEQWICIKFYVKFNISPHENHLEDSAVFQWWCSEYNANKSVARMLQRWSRICWKWSTFWKACKLSRTPENAERVWAAINKDQQLTVWELEAALRIPNTTVSEILTQDLGLKHGMAKFVLWLLLPEQKEHHAAVANNLIQTATNEPDFLKKVRTGGESRVYSYDPEQRLSHPNGSCLVLHSWRRCSKIAARSRPC